MDIKKRLWLGLAAYAGLALLAWQTLSNEPILVFNSEVRLRTVTLILLGIFAFRMLLHFWRMRIEETEGDKREVGSGR